MFYTPLVVIKQIAVLAAEAARLLCRNFELVHSCSVLTSKVFQLLQQLKFYRSVACGTHFE